MIINYDDRHDCSDCNWPAEGSKFINLNVCEIGHCDTFWSYRDLIFIVDSNESRTL